MNQNRIGHLFHHSFASLPSSPSPPCSPWRKRSSRAPLNVAIRLWIHDKSLNNSYKCFESESDMPHFPLKKSKSMGPGFDNLALAQQPPEPVQKAPPKILESMKEMTKHLELMHDRCIARNLRAAGLGAFDNADEEQIYGFLNPNARLETGESMLMAVLTKVPDPEKQARYVSILLVEGADVNEVDLKGRTALMISIERSYEKTSKALVQASTINHYITDHNGWTALHYAAASGRENLVRLYTRLMRKLEQKKSKESLYEQRDELYTMETNDGQTPQQIAESYGHHNLAEILADEKNRKQRSLSKSIGLIHHTGMPSLMDAGRLSRRALKRVASFDSLPFEHRHQDSSDEEGLLTGDDNDLTTTLRRMRHDMKYEDPGKRSYSPIVMDTPNSSSPGPYSTANISINVGVKVGESNNRAAFFQSKGEMMKQVQAHQRLQRHTTDNSGLVGSHFPHLARTPLSPQEDVMSPHNKQKLSDKIRSFLTRKQHKSLTASGSVDNLAKGKYSSMDNILDIGQDYRKRHDIPVEDPWTRQHSVESPKLPKQDVSVKVKADFQQSLNVRNRPNPDMLRAQRALLSLDRPKEENRNKLGKMVSLPPIRNSATMEKKFSDLTLHVEDPVQ